MCVDLVGSHTKMHWPLCSCHACRRHEQQLLLLNYCPQVFLQALNIALVLRQCIPKTHQQVVYNFATQSSFVVLLKCIETCCKRSFGMHCIRPLYDVMTHTFPDLLDMYRSHCRPQALQLVHRVQKHTLLALPPHRVPWPWKILSN